MNVNRGNGARQRRGNGRSWTMPSGTHWYASSLCPRAHGTPATVSHRSWALARRALAAAG